ncbi:MAG: peptidylprolyl isomerase [Muribaculaceae bacterium]|nr:peptidylprolyl isomerase [Muribaculaceae bacterium]
MQKRRFITLGVFVIVCLAVAFGVSSKYKSNMSQNNSREVIADIKTTMGDIKVKLYNQTPLHRDNFVKLAQEGYYDGVLFHRVINDFMVQTGDGDSRDAAKGKVLGSGDPGYTIEAEIHYPELYHKRGVLAAARTGDSVNPEKRSSGSQFYIVTGKTFNDSTLAQIEKRHQVNMMQKIFNRLQVENRDTIMELRRNRDREGLDRLRDELVAKAEAEYAKAPFKIPEDQKQAYKEQGGTPHLDGDYTVFGEVIEGMDVVDKIQKAETDRNDRPLEDIRILSVKIEK